MSEPDEMDEARADIAFLLSRATSAGSCDFTAKRWTGLSSNSLVALAYGGKQECMPLDRSDYAACVRTYARLPRHRRTREVREGLRRAKEAYLARYPDDRFPGPRNALREQWRAEWEANQARKAKRRRRA